VSTERPVSEVIAVLGLGEAGSLLARDLVAAGAAVRGYDPRVPAPAGVTATGSDAEAVTGAGLVLSVNSASEAVGALAASLGALRPGAVWADLNTAAPSVKRRLAEMGRERGIQVTDVAMMAPVPGHGLRVPMLASGDGAGHVAQTLGGYGADVEVLGPRDGGRGRDADRPGRRPDHGAGQPAPPPAPGGRVARAPAASTR
jgi:3-hydroxyisobutyrate dehydrogenase-like beta-hydroxyacid dehydrogenase